MLTKSAIESGLPLLEKLYASDVFLGAVGGSPLQELVSASGVMGTVVSSHNGALAFNSTLAAEYANTADPMTGYSEHDQVMQEVLAKAVPGLMNQIAYARNEGAAVVEELAQRVQAQVDSLTLSSLAGANVTVRKMPAVLQDDAIVEAAEQSRDLPLVDEALQMDLPSLTPGEIRTMLLTGSTSTDTAISEYFTQVTDEQLQQLWDAVYTATHEAGVNLSHHIVGDKNTTGALFVFLTAMRLSAKIIDGANMSEQRYMNVVSNYRNQAARRLCDIIDGYKSIEQVKQLVHEVDGLNVVVNESVYNQFLTNGGSVDAVLGAAISGNPANMTYEALTERCSEFEQAWKDQYMLSRATFVNKRFNRIKDILLSEFRQQCEEASASDFPHADRQIAEHLFSREVQCLCVEDTEDLMMLSLRLLGASRFRNRSVCDILAGIARVRKENPDASAADAATVAITEYVARWVASMITVERKSVLTAG